MTTVIVLDASGVDPLVKLRGAVSNPRPILERIGAIGVAGSQQAFEDEKLGEWVWPERYPNQSEPFINIAGAVADFASGRSEPLPRRFDRRPVLRDTGELLGSLNWRVTGDDSVEWGSTKEYAAAHQFGLTTSQPMDEATRKRMATWLLTEDGDPYIKKLTPLLNMTELETDIVQRPFLGVTAQMEDDIQETVELMIAEASGGRF